MNCKMTGNIGGQTVRCDLREGHGGNHHAVVEATREMQIETERDELHEHAEELSEALAVEREAHGATRRLLSTERAAHKQTRTQALEAIDAIAAAGAFRVVEERRKVTEAEAALRGHRVGVEDCSPEEQDAAMAPWRADPPTAEHPAIATLRRAPVRFWTADEQCLCAGADALTAIPEVLSLYDDLRAKHARQRETIRGAQAALPSDILDASETLGGAITATIAQKDAEIANLKAVIDMTLVAPEPGEHDATLSEWHARRAPDVLERMRRAGAI